MKPLVKSKNLYLRELAETDLDRTWEWLHRPDIYTKIGVQVPFSKEQQKQWFARLKEDNTKMVFAVCLLKNDAHIGNVSLDMIDLRHKNARLSIFIADNDTRGKGLGTEALFLLEEYAFKKLNLHKIWCKTDANDLKVLEFYKKLGFEQEGIWKEHEIRNGQYLDKVLFGKISK